MKKFFEVIFSGIGGVVLTLLAQNFVGGSSGMLFEEKIAMEQQISEYEKQIDALQEENEKLHNQLGQSQNTGENENVSEGTGNSVPETVKSGKIFLKNMDVFQDPNSKFVLLSPGVKDYLGNTFNNAFGIKMMQRENTPEETSKYCLQYSMAGNYETLSGSLAYHEDNSGNYKLFLTVCCDGVAKYTSDPIGPATSPKEFSVDISGADLVQLYVFDEENHANNILYDDVLILDNVTVQ